MKYLRKALIAALVLSLLFCGCRRWNPLTSSPPYLEVNGQEVESPSLDDLEEGIQGLSGGANSYVYLEPSNSIDGIWSLSATLPLEGFEDGLGYIVDACWEEDNDYRYYECRTTDQEQLLDWFRDFYRGRSAPDISGWEDVTNWYYDDYGYDDYGYDDDDGYGYDGYYDYSYDDRIAAI